MITSTLHSEKGSNSSGSLWVYVLIVGVSSAFLVKKSINLALVLCAMYGLYLLSRHIKPRRGAPESINKIAFPPVIWALFGLLCAPFAWVLILGIIREQFDIDQLDEYFRHVIAACALLAFYGKVTSKHWAWFKALTALGSIGLLLLIFWGYDQWNWDQRYATYFVDPNSLGIAGFVQGAVLSLAVAQSTNWSNDARIFGVSERTWGLLLLAGAVSGWAVSVMSGTRGVWLAIIPLLFVLLTVSKQPTRAIGVTIVGVALVILLASQSSFLQKRYYDAVRDVDLWINSSQVDTPVGIRLSIYSSLYRLAQVHPWLGMHPEQRDQTFQSLPDLSPVAKYTLIESGAHNQYLEKQILNGIPGSLLALMLFLLPLVYFWSSWRKAAQLELRFAYGLAVIVCLCYLVSGMSLVLTLKYLNSYWAACVIIAATAIPAKSNGASHV